MDGWLPKQGYAPFTSLGGQISSALIQFRSGLRVGLYYLRASLEVSR